MTAILSKDLLLELQSRLTSNPQDAEALLALGVHECYQDNFPVGLRYMQEAVALKPQEWRYHYNIGGMYQACHQLDNAVLHSLKAAELQSGNADIWFALGELFMQTGESLRALAAYNKALSINPRHAQACAALKHFYQKHVKAWHFSMMNDVGRNQAYERAFATQVRGKAVLEIGAGSGLLSMMASRAGASHVYACEEVPVIVEKAKEIIHQNGFDDAITVFAKSSYDMQVEDQELPAKADVLILETFDSHLIGEDVLAIIRDARARLLAPDALIVPARGVIMLMLVESEELYQQMTVGEVSGFDLSAFNEFNVKPSIVVTAQNYGFVPLSDAVEAVSYDFIADTLEARDVHFTLPITRSGVCHAILSWIKLDMGGGVIYENSPLKADEMPRLHWQHSLQCMENPLHVQKGGSVSMFARHTQKQFIFSIGESG